jgi:4-hydroxyacetophenone monooxygenase
MQVRAFNEGVEQIAQALAQAHIPSLQMALVHLTGDAAWLAGAPWPVYDFFGDGQGGFSAEGVAAVQAAALQALLDYRVRGYTLPEKPGTQTLQAMMNYSAGAQIPEHYLAFLQEELGLEAADQSAINPSIAATAQAKEAFPVVVIGAGMSGLLAGIALKNAGLPFIIVEKAAQIGGTWAANRYPGCRVDSPNHLYSYSFARKPDWPLHFSLQRDLLGYFEDVARQYGLYAHIKLQAQVVRATWQESMGLWFLEVRDAHGVVQTLQARAVICAVGQLSQPKIPHFPGIESFQGPVFHSANWPVDLDLSGKRVGVVGTGASAFQFVPALVDRVAHMDVYQRTPPWLGPTPTYHDPVTPEQQWLLDYVPFYSNWYRFWLFWMLTDGVLPAVEVDPSWQDGARSVSQANAEMRVLLEDYIRSQLTDRPDLLDKVTPGYPPGGKRFLRDNGVWLAALKQPHVDLLTVPISHIVPDAIVTKDGVAHPTDVLIYGTGFQASAFLAPMEIVGRGGQKLHDVWAGDARAYLGMCVPDFPNFFMLYGPNTNIVVNGSIIFFSECSVRYVMDVLRQMLEQGAKAWSVRADVFEAFNARVDCANQLKAWGSPYVTSWYKSASGRVSQNWPFSLADYWWATRAASAKDFNRS